MITYILYFIIFILLGLIGFLTRKLYIFATIIMAFEDDLSESIETFENAKESLNGIIELKMFFDNNEIQLLISRALESIKLAERQIGKTVKKFTDRSKKKFYIIEEIDEEINETEEN